MTESRSKENGSLAFHTDTEDRLSKYVIETATKNDPDSVIKQIDSFCWTNHWMMHVGDKKGKIVDNIIAKHNPKTILELGTYCGYSAIRMAMRLPNDGLVITIDPYPLDATKLLIDHAGLSNKIKCHEGLASEVIPHLNNYKNKIDMVFIDHDKKAYLTDLLLIEKHELLHSNSVVVADNVIIFKINDFLNHVRTSPSYSSSVNYLSTLEYDDSNAETMIDGIEVSIWKGR